MKKPTDLPGRGETVESLNLRVARLERTTAALSARILELFGPTPKHADAVAPGAVRPAIAPAAR